jgi:hypothetical protein
VAITVTATASGAGSSNGIYLGVRVVNNASLTQNGATAASGTVTVPDLAITPGHSGNIVYGVVGNGSSATAFASPQNSITSLLNITGVGGSGRFGMYSATPTTTSSTTYGWLTPTGTSGFVFICEAEIVGTSPSEDASTPADVTTTTALNVTTASFTPPGAAVLVAIVASEYSGTGTITHAITDNSSGAYTWTRLVRSDASVALTSVWVGIPVNPPSTAAPQQTRLLVAPGFRAPSKLAPRQPPFPPTPTVIHPGTAGLDGAGTLGGTPAIIVPGAAALTGQGDLTATGSLEGANLSG